MRESLHGSRVITDMHIFETFNGFTLLILLALAGAWLALLAYEGKL